MSEHSRLLGLLLSCGLCSWVMVSCAATNAHQNQQFPPSPKDIPVVDSLEIQATQQSGQGNLSNQMDVSGWTGIEYSTAVPVGQVLLMFFMLFFSHRRELARIRQNNGSGGVSKPVAEPVRT